MAKKTASDAVGNGCWKKHVRVLGIASAPLGIIAALVISICFARASAVEEDLKAQETRLQAVERVQAAQKERDRAILADLAEIKEDVKELRKRGGP